MELLVSTVTVMARSIAALLPSHLRAARRRARGQAQMNRAVLSPPPQLHRSTEPVSTATSAAGRQGYLPVRPVKGCLRHLRLRALRSVGVLSHSPRLRLG